MNNYGKYTVLMLPRKLIYVPRVDFAYDSLEIEREFIRAVSGTHGNRRVSYSVLRCLTLVSSDHNRMFTACV